MKQPTFDADGYPAEETLLRIETWTALSDSDLSELLDFCKAAWNQHFGAVSHELKRSELTLVAGSLPHGKYLRLVTGGWSGNESVIAAMRVPALLWSRCWRMSARGGLYVMEYPQ